MNCFSLRFWLLWLALCAATAAAGQLITAVPAFPNENSPVTIFFDATQGNGGLANCNCDVYLHTGVLTNLSVNPSNWRHVVTAWGQANPAWRMTPVPGQPNVYSYTISPSIRAYYNVPAAETVEQLAFVFRNANGSLEGKDVGNADIYYQVYPPDLALTTSILSPAQGEIDLALGQTITVSGAASAAASLSLYDNGVLIAEAQDATELIYDLTPEVSGTHLVQFVAASNGSSDTSSFTYRASLQAVLLAPANPVQIVQLDEVINVTGISYIVGELRLTDNGVLLAEAQDNQLNYALTVQTGGTHEVEFSVTYNGETATTRFVYVIAGDQVLQDPPAGTKDGITYQGDSGAYLQLHAPNKQVVYVVGDFNDWLPGADYLMNKSLDGSTFWIEVAGLTPGQNYAFQYLVDGELYVADPHSPLVLDPWNDSFIPAITYPDLPAYPVGKATGIVSVLQPGAEPYVWLVEDFVPPAKEKLVMYELLVRDFLARHDYQTLIDTLDYLQDLGVNAIELMPPNEFEGNISWGYNPSFHAALDKYYGDLNTFKRLVDECHSRGIAVILDVVYNHAFSLSPLAQMYWDPDNFRPRADNPWLNVTPRHPFNVGDDFNHQSAATRRYVDQVMTYWLEETRVDGFRFDLSKGFTQNQTNDVGAWSNYDAARIATLKRYADVVWAVNPDAYVILEHFATNTEEKELADYGMMLWTNLTHEFGQAVMGYASNLNSASYKNRNWNDPHLITYMESHDEERLIYKALQFGNSSGNYNTRQLQTALRRVELASVLFYSIPGPKMLWQFGEVGYGFSINYCANGTISDNCRTDPKPIRWDYFQDPNRRRLYDITRAMTTLKTTYEVFNTENFSLNSAGLVKTVRLTGDDMRVVAMGNFAVTSQNLTNPFPQGGWWYEYFTGDSTLVDNPATPLSLAAGEYRLYSTTRLSEPPGGYLTDAPEVMQGYFSMHIAPNPAQGTVSLSYELPEASRVQVALFDINGRQVSTLLDERQMQGLHRQDLRLEVPPGIYLVRLVADGKVETQRLVVAR